MVTFRIRSNLDTFGFVFARECEAKRLIRKGYSKATSYLMADKMVHAVYHNTLG